MHTKGLSLPMSDAPMTPPEPTPVIEMPWVLISNQIQQLNENMNQRFNDERIRMDDRFAAQERHVTDRFDAQDRNFSDRFAAIDRRFDAQDRNFSDRFTVIEQRLDKMDQRFDKVDEHFDKLEHRLEFRVNTWLAIILAALTLIIGVLLGHSAGL